MASTTTDNTALHGHLVSGETLFVAGAMLAFLSEVALAFRALMLPSAVGTIIDLVFIVGTLYLINWLYTGRREARQPALAWIGLQIVIALAGCIILFNSHAAWARRPAAWIHNVMPSDWLALAKVAAYSFFGYLLCARTPALFFLRHRGGEHVELPTPSAPLEDVAPAGVAVPLAPPELATAGNLAGMLQGAGGAFIAAGVFEAAATAIRFPLNRALGWIELAEGIVLILLGLSFLVPVNSVRNVAERGADRNYVIDSIGKLAALYGQQIVLVLVYIGLTIGGLALRLR